MINNALKRFALSMVLLGASPLFLRAAFIVPEAEQQFTAAAGAFQSGKYESAVAEGRNFLKNFPRHRRAPAVEYMMAESYFLQGRYTEAAAAFKDFIDNNRGPEAHNLVISARLRLGECHFNLKKYLTAIDHFTWVEKSENDSFRAEAQLGTAYSYLARAEYDKAEVYLLKLLQSHAGYANLPKVVVPLGLITMQRGQYQQALDLFSRAPDDKACLYYRGVCQRFLNRVIASALLMKELLDSDTGKEWTDKALYQMGEAYFQSKEYPLAYSSFKKLYTTEIQSPLRPYALFRMGCVNFQNGAFEPAAQNWSQLVKEFPESLSGPASQYLLAEISLRQNELGKAIAGFSPLTGQDEYAMDAQYKVIWCLAVQGQYDLAISKADRFVKDYEWGDLHAKVTLIKGLCQQMMKKTDDALSTYQFLLDRYPNTVYYEKALYLMATAMVQDNRYAEVVTHVYGNLKASPASPSRWQAETYFWVAESYYNIGQYELARQTYDVIAKNYRTTELLPSVMLGVAACLARLGQYDQAIEIQQKALDLAHESENPDVKKSALLDSADVLFNKREYEKAAGYYEEFTKRYPDDTRVERALFQSGQALYRMEYFTEAVAKWTLLADRFKNGALAPEATFQAGRTYFGLGQYQQAYNSFNKLVQLYPDAPLAKEAKLQMGQCHYNAGNIPRAIEEYKSYLQKYPADEHTSEVQELLQMAYYKQSQSAGSDLKELVNQFPQSKFTADIYWELGAEAYNRKDYDKALDYFQRLILDFPDSSQVLQAYYYKADTYFMKGDYANAVTGFKNFVVNYPQDSLAKDARFKLAVSLFSLKDYLQAAVAFNDFIEAHPSDPKARDAGLNIPLCYGKAGQPYQAVDAYSNFLRRFPGDAKTAFVYLQVGQLYEDAEDWAKAVESYKKIAADKPEIFEAYFSLGRCYKKMKAGAEEAGAYEALRALSPKDNKFRLAGLVILGELYENARDIQKAVGVYQDIFSYSTNAEWRSVAQDKIKALGGKGR